MKEMKNKNFRVRKARAVEKETMKSQRKIFSLKINNMFLMMKNNRNMIN
jgi:hypothetical protein